MKEFTTAVKAHDDAQEGNEEGWTEFTQDGVLCRARRPEPGQVIYLTAVMHKRAKLVDQIAGAVNFVMDIMDDDTASHLAERLMDPKDDFGIEEIDGIMRYLIEEWSGKATESSDDSSESPPSTGRTSKPTTRARVS